MTQQYRFSKAVCQYLATLCSLDIDFICNALEVPPDQLYRRFTKPKKRGGFRVLHEPCEELKIVQGAFLEYLYKSFIPEKRFFGFMPGRSIVDNARHHLWYDRTRLSLPRTMFHVDLKDSFTSVRDTWLWKMYMDMFSQRKVAYHTAEDTRHDLTKYREFLYLLICLTTHNRCLPQGAPTSPYLQNLMIAHRGVLNQIDAEFKGLKVQVSIYADDITVSMNNYDHMSWRFRKRVIRAIQRTGFRVNPAKTRYNEVRRKAHLITGVSMTLGPDGQPKLTMARKKRDKIRSILYRATKALEDGRVPSIEQDGVTLFHAHGNAGLVQQVYEGYAMPTDIGVGLVDFKIAYARYKEHKRQFVI